MKTVKSAALAAVCCFNASMLAYAAAPTSPSLTVPAIPGAAPAAANPAATAPRPAAASAPGVPSASAGVKPAVVPASAAVPPAHAPSPSMSSATSAQPRSDSGVPAPDRKLTLGDWEDLGERRAYKAQLEKINGAAAAPATAPAAPPLPAMPPMPALPQMMGQPGMMQLVPEKKRPRFSEACPDDDRPCFFSVYGLSMEDGTNNYRGQLAINGRLVPGGVYKGKKFDGYTVTEITGSALTVVDKRGRKHVWPLYSAGDYAADPQELTPQRPAYPGQFPAVFPATPYTGSVR